MAAKAEPPMGETPSTLHPSFTADVVIEAPPHRGHSPPSHHAEVCTSLGMLRNRATEPGPWWQHEMADLIAAPPKWKVEPAAAQCRQHFLNFLPLPQGQGSLRPTAQSG